MISTINNNNTNYNSNTHSLMKKYLAIMPTLFLDLHLSLFSYHLIKGVCTHNYPCDAFGWIWREWGQNDCRRWRVSTKCHRMERAQGDAGKTLTGTLAQWVDGGGEWVGLQRERETKQARVRVSKEQCQRQQQRLAATGTPVICRTCTHAVSATIFPPLSL